MDFLICGHIVLKVNLFVSSILGSLKPLISKTFVDELIYAEKGWDTTGWDTLVWVLIGAIKLTFD